MSQTSLLARALFRRFFETDLIPPGGDAAQTVIAFLTLLAAPGLLLPFRFSLKYVELAARSPDALARALITDRLLFITLTFIALGLVALVIWEGVFPDRRDARVLGALPIPERVMIRARLAALAGLAGIFMLGVNTVPTLIYGSVLGISGGAITPIHGILAHLLTNLAAGTFVFCGLIALQGLLLNVVGRRSAERLSIVLQLLFVVGLLQLVFFFPHLFSIVTARISDLTSHPVLRFVPSVWFLGLYDVLGGDADPGAWSLALTAVAATATAVGSSVVLLSATHGRLMRLALETRDATGRGNSITRIVSRLFNTYVVRRPIERALCAFTLKTLMRSRTHRMLMAVYLGIALALSLSGLIPMLIRFGVQALEKPGVFVLSIPLMVLFITLAGLRAVFALPVEPRANWVFRLLEPANRTTAIDGARDAMLVAAVAPIATAALVSGAVAVGAVARIGPRRHVFRARLGPCGSAAHLARQTTVHVHLLSRPLPHAHHVAGLSHRLQHVQLLDAIARDGDDGLSAGSDDLRIGHRHDRRAPSPRPNATAQRGARPAVPGRGPDGDVPGLPAQRSAGGQRPRTWHAAGP